MPTLTLQAKLIIAAILAAMVAYSYVWTFHQGVKVGGADATQQAFQNLNKKLQEQADSDAEYRRRELQNSKQDQDKINKAKDKLIGNLKQSNEILQREANKQLASTAIPDDLVVVLNDARRFDSGSQGTSIPSPAPIPLRAP
jgi:type II secretory pathway pseudopilin PulG